MFTTALPSRAGAQSSVWLDAAVSTARPPAGVPESHSSTYAVYGAHADVGLQRWRLDAVASAGNAFEAGAGEWYWLQADAVRSFVKLSGFWLDYRNAFKYSLAGMTFEPRITMLRGKVTVRPSVTFAGWSSDSLSAAFGAAGVTADAERRSGNFTFRLTGDVYSAGNNGYSSGRYLSLGADAFTTIGRTSFGAGVLRGKNPVKYETGFSIWASQPWNERLQLGLQIGRPLADAIFGSPGTFGATLSGSWRVLHKRYRPPAQPALLGGPTRNGRSVRFTVRVAKARSVAVSGTFTNWEPVAMLKTADVWTLEIPVAAGTHQYGFLVNEEEWYLPPDAKDVIDDGFGRKNATLIVQ